MADYFPSEKNTVPAAGSTHLFGFNRNGLVIDHLLQKAEVIGPNARTVFGMLAPQPDGTWGYRDAHLSVLTTKNAQPVTGDVRLFPGDVIAYRAGQGLQERTVFKMFLTSAGPAPFKWHQLPLGESLPALALLSSGDVLRLFNYQAPEGQAFLELTEKGHFLEIAEGAPVKINGNSASGRVLLSHLDILQIEESFFVYLSGTIWIGSAAPVALQKKSDAPPAPAVPSVEPSEPAAPVKNQAPPVPAKPPALKPRSKSPEAGAPEAPSPEAPSGNLPAGQPEKSAKSPGPAAPLPSEGKGSPQDPPEDTGRPALVSAIRHDAALQGAGLKINIRERTVRKGLRKRTLLKDIRLEVDPGDFVLILGGSGAGKSTFIKSVMGYDRADGTIRYGDLDVYKDYEKVKYEIGYVPQQNLIRLNDTVYDTLYAEARMKMPGNSTREEYRQQVEWAMSLLGLQAERGNLCASISGGQLKRLSIAIELVGDPGIFFLDEPDSGLDGTMSRLLMENLSEIAALGKMVMIITHGPNRAADLFTRVLVLGKTADNVGRLLFYGSVKEALAFFEVDSLEQIVKRINSKAEGGEGLADHFLDKFTALRARDLED